MIVKNIQKLDNPLNMINEWEYTSLDILLKVKGDIPNFANVKKLFQEADALTTKEVNEFEWLSKKQEALMVVRRLS